MEILLQVQSLLNLVYQGRSRENKYLNLSLLLVPPTGKTHMEEQTWKHKQYKKPSKVYLNNDFF